VVFNFKFNYLNLQRRSSTHQRSDAWLVNSNCIKPGAHRQLLYSQQKVKIGDKKAKNTKYRRYIGIADIFS